jgi:hypothetical protein
MLFTGQASAVSEVRQLTGLAWRGGLVYRLASAADPVLIRRVSTGAPGNGYPRGSRIGP